MDKSALILGASGLVGRHCLDLLLEDDYYRTVKIFVRKELPITHPKLAQHVVDFEQMENYVDLFRVNDIYCCLGTTIKKAGSEDNFYRVDFTYPFDAAQIGIQHGVEQFLIVSSLGANQRSLVFYNRVKGQLEETLSVMPFKALHIFQPSLLLGQRPEFRIGEHIGIILVKLLSFLLIGPWKKYRGIDARTVAKAMVIQAKLNMHGKKTYESDIIQMIVDEEYS
jgi:uncharacterized protein YbjT (DUF2867 family)